MSGAGVLRASGRGGERLAAGARLDVADGFRHGRLALVATALVLQGCVPFPHFEGVAPQLGGVVHARGQPLSGVPVRYAHERAYGEPDCHDSDAVTTTDDDGRFFLEAGRDFRWFLVLGDPVYEYDLCVESGGELALLLRRWDFGMAETRAELECDLLAPLNEDPRGRGRCTVTQLQ